MSSPTRQPLELVEVFPEHRRDRATFVRLPFDLARDHPPWQPGIRRLADELIDPAKNPFWRGRAGSFFVARRDGRVVGRVAVLDPGTLGGEARAAVLAFPDFIDDDEVSALLFKTATERAVERGAERLIGPLNPDIHHDVGVQIDGQHRRNTVFMGYHPAYYRRHFEDVGGFSPLADFNAWELYSSTFIADGELRRMVDQVESRGALRIRPIDLKRFPAELELFHRLYSGAFADHWGFTPPSWEEFQFLAGDLRHILKSRMALVAEWDGEPAGFALGIPDLNEILPKGSGRLTPAFLFQTLMRWRRITEVRIMIAGVLPAFRRQGIHLPLFYHHARETFELGYRGGEISWVMADNVPMVRTLPLMGARVSKTYRLYAKALHQ